MAFRQVEREGKDESADGELMGRKERGRRAICMTENRM